MNVDNQTVLHIKAGHKAPEELLQIILGTKPNVFGFAVQEESSSMEVVREDGFSVGLEELKGFMEESIQRPRSLYFGTLDAGHNPEDIQPFVLDDPDDNTFMSIFTEGDILGNNDDKSRTEHYNFINGIIIPKIIDWCTDFDGDIDKVMSKVTSEIFNKEFLMHVGHRAILHILPFKGDAVLLGRNALGADYEWGWTSRTHGFGDIKQEPEVEKPVKKSYGWGKKAAAVAASPSPAPVTASKDKPTLSLPKDVATKGEGPRTSTPAVKTQTTIAQTAAVRPPSWLHKNEDVKSFYSILTGSIPGNWKKRIPVIPSQNHKLLEVTSLEQFKKYQLEQLLKNKASTDPVAQPEVQPQAQPQPQPDIQPKKSDDLPIIGPKELDKVLDFVAKHLDGNSKGIIPPQEMQKIEAKLPTFSEAVGVKLEEMLNWPVSGLFALAATDPKAMVLWGLEWRAYARQHLLAALKKNEKAEEVTTTTTKLTETATKVESVAKPTGGKKNSWGFKKVA